MQDVAIGESWVKKMRETCTIFETTPESIIVYSK
jgi:hypothetical protein